MSEYNELDMVIDFYDTKRFVDGCKCEPDVNHTCELCSTYDTLREAKRMLLLRDTEIERLQKDRSRSENELDRLREWVAAVEDGYDKQKAEIERLRDQHDTYAKMVEQLTRQLDAAAVLLRHPDSVEWVYDAEENAPAYFLDGKFAGPTIRHVIRMAAKEG